MKFIPATVEQLKAGDAVHIAFKTGGRRVTRWAAFARVMGLRKGRLLSFTRLDKCGTPTDTPEIIIGAESEVTMKHAFLNLKYAELQTEPPPVEYTLPSDLERIRALTSESTAD